MRHLHIVAAWFLSFFAGGSPAAAQPADGIRALAVQYADGRTTNTVLSPTGRVSWTPTFPRVPGADTSRDGLPLTALQFEEAVDGPRRIVTIALLYGSPHQARVQVATVPLNDDRLVRVAELEGYGVKPVALSIVTLPRPAVHLPSITTPSSQLEVNIDVTDGDVPLYRVVVTNRSSQAVMGYSFKAYRGDVISISGSPHGAGHVPLIPPGEKQVATYPIAANGNRGSTPNVWLPLDRFVITSVTWSDGVVEGDPKPAATTSSVEAGTAEQLVRVIALIRVAAGSPEAHPLPQLRADIAALPIAVSPQESPGARSLMAVGMQNAKNAALNDIDEFLKTPAETPYATWLASMAAKYGAWRNRLLAR